MFKWIAALCIALLLAACNVTPTPTPVPVTATSSPVPPTSTPVPPTASASPTVQIATITPTATRMPTSTPATTPTLPAGGVPRPDHVVVVIFENRAYSQIIGNACCAYINQQANASALLTQSFGVTHPSQPNYLDLFSGSDQGVRSDACPPPGSPYSTPNLGQQLIDAGLTFAGFSEDLPAAGSTVCNTSTYARKHNPWVNFSNVPASANLQFSSFPSDFTKLPAVSFVIPNLCNDMHDCPSSTGDAWLSSHLDGYIQWAKTHNSLLILTFDEDNRLEGNRIVTFFEGPMVRVGQYGENINHYNVLRTIEAMYGLPGVGQAANAATITDIWIR